MIFPDSNHAALAAFRRFCIVLLLVGPVGACSDQRTETLSPEEVSALANVVVGEAARGLRSDGRFTLAASTPGEQPEITESHAKELAGLWPRQWGRLLRGSLEREHGGPVEVSALVVCGQTYYARSPFAPVPAAIPDIYHRYFGPWYLVPLCSPAGEVQVSLAVSALATNLSIRDGRIEMAPGSGHDFFAVGVPRGWDGVLAASAERAVLRTASLTGARIAEVPVLYAPDPHLGVPQAASWKIVLDDSVALRGRKSGTTRKVREVFVGLQRFVGGAATDDTLGVGIATAAQPAARSIEYEANLNDPRRDPGRSSLSTFTLHHLPDVPLNLEKAVRAPGSN